MSPLQSAGREAYPGSFSRFQTSELSALHPHSVHIRAVLGVVCVHSCVVLQVQGGSSY